MVDVDSEGDGTGGVSIVDDSTGLLVGKGGR